MKLTRKFAGLLVVAAITFVSTGCHMTGHGMPPGGGFMPPMGGG